MKKTHKNKEDKMHKDSLNYESNVPPMPTIEEPSSLENQNNSEKPSNNNSQNKAVENQDSNIEAKQYISSDNTNVSDNSPSLAKTDTIVESNNNEDNDINTQKDIAQNQTLNEDKATDENKIEITAKAQQTDIKEVVSTAEISGDKQFYKDTMATTNTEIDQKLNSLKSKNTFVTSLLLLTIVALVGISYYGYQQLNNVNKVYESTKNYETSLLDAKNTINENLNSQNALKEEISNLLAENKELKETNTLLSQKIDSFTDKIQQNNQIVDAVNKRLNVFEAQNPNEWRIAKSVFMVNDAYVRAVWNQDKDSAIWFLQEADNALLNLKEKNISNIRKAIANDIAKLKAIETIDYEGIQNTLEASILNIDKVAFKDFSTYSNVLLEDTNVSGNINDWQQNLLKSVKNFSARFIEVHKKDSTKELTAFLSLKEQAYVREQLKLRVTLAISSLTQKQEQAYKDNLNEALKILNTYFKASDSSYKALFDDWSKLANTSIKSQYPDTLESYLLINEIIKKDYQSLVSAKAEEQVND